MIMENKYVKVPFDVEMAKRIHSGECEGRIVTNDDRSVRIVCWDYKEIMGERILALVQSKESRENIFAFDNKGRNDVNEHLSPLWLEIPEYMTFKDGDIVKQSNDTYTWLSIIKDIDLYDDGKGGLWYFTNEYVSMLINDGDGSIDIDTHSDAGQKVERATEEEKLKLIDAMKANESPKAKEYLKRFFGIEEKPKYQYKDGDLYMTPNGGIGIYSDKYECEDYMPYHIFMDSDGRLFRSNSKGGKGKISECKPVTSATDRSRMFKALREDENLISKACLKKYFGDEDWIKHIRFKECVLVRGLEQDVWVPAEYGYYSEKLASHVVFNGMGWKHCIPYTIHTKHLMGTTDNWEEIV